MADNMLILSILYIVLAMILVSLSGTYNFTYKLLHTMFGVPDQATWGTGSSLTSVGFMVHVIVFALLIAVPMFMAKKQ